MIWHIYSHLYCSSRDGGRDLLSSGGAAPTMGKVLCEFRADQPGCSFSGEKLRQESFQPCPAQDGALSMASSSGCDMAHLLTPVLLIKTFLQDFPRRFSHKNFPQDFPTKFCHKIFPSWILIGWLPITLFQMLNFHQSLPFLNWLFPLLLVLQDFPARISRKISCKIFLQDFPAKFSHKNFQQDFPTRFSCKIFPSWILIGWLPITLFQMLNFHQSLPLLNYLFPLLLVLQEFPSRFSQAGS